MVSFSVVTFSLLLFSFTSSWPFDPEQVSWNLNQNKTATDVLDYSGKWDDHDFHPSPANWRFPFYTLFLDRFINGDPTNDDANGTAWEHDLGGTQLRHGGDVKGLQDTLDYLVGMGIKGLYIAGSPMINMPWGADGYSPLDFSLLDAHFGTIEAWRDCISAIHQRGLYIILDNTMGTMGDLIGFQGYLNVTAPFKYQEHDVLWKGDRKYRDFDISNDELSRCDYPRFYNDSGSEVLDNGTQMLIGCRNSEFDQYGDIQPFAQYPEWQRQLSKFGSVQDRLREWKPSVLEKIAHFSCLQIAMLDIDGFRMDKGIQITVDAQADFASSIRQCAKSFGKDNFLISGELVGGNSFNSIYIGRGKESSMIELNTTKVVTTISNNSQNSMTYIREPGKAAVDAACFDYSTFRGMTRFLGLDGQLEATYDTPVNFVDSWRYFIQTQDMNNVNTGVFDPRHMYGTQNQDQFRWPAIVNGTDRQNLGTFIVTMLMPGIPILEWGEEQAFYVLDSTAANYLYGRQAMSASTAWQDHGCYKVGSSVYINWPGQSALVGCKDDWNSLDHRDPSHPIRNIMKTMFELRTRFPVLNDGYNLQQLSNLTYDIYLPGSHGTPTEKGLWSVLRSRWPGVQDFTGEGQGNQAVWLLYHNEGDSKSYSFDCSDNATALISPFDEGTAVKNLFYPFDEHTLVRSPQKLGLEKSTKFNGCLTSLGMPSYGYKAFVPTSKWLRPSPVITAFLPGHDSRLLSTVDPDGKETVAFELHFSDEMECNNVVKVITIDSKTFDGSVPSLDQKSVQCHVVQQEQAVNFTGQVATGWILSGNLKNVANGIHRLTITNATTQTGNASTNAVDHFLLRIGQSDNPMVFPRTGNYSNTLLHRYDNGTLYISHKAAGADQFRYSTNFGSSWSDWQGYNGGNVSIESQTWSGTSTQAWSGEHILVQYWSQMTGSSDQVQQGDLADNADKVKPRRYPHFFIQGSFNEYGYDGGLPNAMIQDQDGVWEYDFVTEWPSKFIANVWGVDNLGRPDVTRAFGDVDNDTVLDLLPPVTLQDNTVHVASYPRSPHLAYRIILNDADLRYILKPIGSRGIQIVVFILLAIIPVTTGILGIYAYRYGFYSLTLNKVGVTVKHHMFPPALRRKLRIGYAPVEEVSRSPGFSLNESSLAVAGPLQSRRTILIATMEYYIEDWNIKVKIGGLGVMAQLMAKHLEDKNLIWVVPCFGEIDYPVDQPAEPMHIKVMANEYTVQVQYHIYKNITFVLLDAPVFRTQTKLKPYPARMDDFDSAVYYSAWNSCIAEAIRRFPQIDLYHINDYHGALAPLHILPQVIPCCLSLHNAEFQGLWPLRTPKEMEEICGIFDLDAETVRKYVQFGEVFNLLHAAASYLRIHQKGFGAVGVSAKYGKRSFQRYPIFWGLRKIGSLPNPDPADTGDLDHGAFSPDETLAPEFDADKKTMKSKTQEFAGLRRSPEAELFCFVGRMSSQKGIDLIADVFPHILKKYPTAQLICIGPIIDLYGKFAASKLQRLMKANPGRVCVIPKFTSVPSYVFGGVDWALIPSRDEPFGLVAVEFGRRGVLCIGARVGGLGQMPGFWYSIESTTTKHLLSQFTKAIETALATKPDVRAKMQAQATTQRFPVAQWQDKLVDLQDKAIKISEEQALKASRGHKRDGWGTATPTSMASRPVSGLWPPSPFRGRTDVAQSISSTRAPSPTAVEQPPTTQDAPLSLGTNVGPGYVESDDRGRRRLRKEPPNTPRYQLHDTSQDTNSRVEEYYLTPEQADNITGAVQLASLGQAAAPWAKQRYSNSPGSVPGTPRVVEALLSPYDLAPPNPGSMKLFGVQADHGWSPAEFESTLSFGVVTQGKKDYQLQNVEPTFTDPTGLYFDRYEKILDDMDVEEKSGDSPAIEEYLIKSEKDWFNRLYNVKMGKPISGEKRTSSIYPSTPAGTTPAGSIFNERFDESRGSDDGMDQFLLQENYVPPSGIRRILLIKIREWPIYSFLLAFGQIIAANSYQITLLTGEVGQPAEKLYIIATIYCVTSIIWWIGFRLFKSLYILTVPFVFYGFAFFILGFSPYVKSIGTRGWLQNVATGFYAAASSSGSFYFALNFGSEGSVPVATWAFRASVIQGTQQAYVVLLWFWGARLTKDASSAVGTTALVSYGPSYTGIVLPIAIILWAVGVCLFFGLPDYYRQAPGHVPSFYKSITSRKIILWFFVVVIVQNFFLSAPYGRNWKYLWSSQHAPQWAIGLLVILFFGVIWAIYLYFFNILSRSHSWILPVFAIGLGAPRWCQILWGTSGMGQYVPWIGSSVAGALVARSLWLWLGVLDALQGVGFGMILLQTMTRFHVTFTLVSAQVLGSLATILARAVAPDKDGPGPVFPNLTLNLDGLKNAWFWIGMGLQLGLCLGFFKFFRKEQLQKP